MPGFFSNTLAVLRREIHRVARQPMYWLLTVILPIVAFAFFAVLLYKGEWHATFRSPSWTRTTAPSPAK